MLVPFLVAMAIAAQLGTTIGFLPEARRITQTAWSVLKGPVTFQKQAREVTNWRSEALSRLDVSLATGLATFAGQAPANLPRCIKLNNYWCIKRAGWAGEIASDNEGHVAFSSASEGAQTAALLLRRYYVDFGRHSAFAIVSRWAPANCGYTVQVTRTSRTVRRSIAPVAPRVRTGLANTLRGRWLEAHSGRVAGGRSAAVPLRRSVVRNFAVALIRAPSIEAGVTEAPASSSTFNATTLAQLEPAILSSAAKAAFTTSTMYDTNRTPVLSCAAENQRISNYAARASAGITANVNDDLALFTPDGNPLPNLEKIMWNMASVEIGPWKADHRLIQGAIVRANEARIALVATRKAAAEAARTAAAARKAVADAAQTDKPRKVARKAATEGAAGSAPTQAEKPSSEASSMTLPQRPLEMARPPRSAHGPEASSGRGAAALR